MRIDFGEFSIDLALRELSKGGQALSLEPKALDLLILLVENHHRAVTREEILEQVWGDVIVTDASLSTAVAQIRRVLGDDGQKQAYIKTVRGFGFRLAVSAQGPVGRVTVTTAEQSVEPDTPAEPGALGGRPVLAVLPFRLVGTDLHHHAIAEAIPAELISSISRLRWLNVIARGSSFRFSGADIDIDDIRSRLGAGYVLSGSVELAGSELRIFVELTDTHSHTIVWCNHFSGSLDRVFETRESIARDVVSLMELHVPLHEAQRLAHVPSENLDAWGHYHLGFRHLYRYNRDDNHIAQKHFTAAIRMDPHFARAYAGLSYTEFQNHFQKFGHDLEQHRSDALRYAESALALDPVDPYSNLMLGRAKWLFADVEGGLNHIDNAIRLNPNYSFAYYNSATLNTVLCNSEEADRLVDNSLVLSPIDPHLQSMWGTRALAALVREDMPAAVQYIDRALRAQNPHLYVYMIAAAIFALIGDHGRANQHVQQIRAKGVGFGSKDFLAHFDLRDQGRKKILAESLGKLGL